MHVVTNRRQGAQREYVTHLLRRSYREGGKVRNETLANLSHLPEEVIELVRGALRGERYVPADAAFAIERSLPAGHVSAVLAMARRLDLARLLDRAPSRERDLALALIVQRVLAPGSKLQSARLLGQSTLASELGVEGVDEDDLYAALDWLGERQERIEQRLAGRHLGDGEMVFYDLSSSYFEGRTCPLAKLGYSRDGRRGTPQIVYGLMTDRAGKPVAVQVFAGNVHDHQTVPAQLAKLKTRFGLAQIVLVADRGMVTRTNIEALAAADGVEWITALKAPQVKKLAQAGTLQPSLFDQINLAEITADAFPGERLVVCRNPLVAAERTRKRDELLAATESELAPIADRVKRGTLIDAGEIGLAVGPAIKRFRMKKHFDIEITDGHFAYRRKPEQITAEAALDGIYILRTTVAADQLDTAEIVRAYKDLQHVEQAFRVLKGPELEVRPIHHRLEHRVRAHIFCCMLSLYLERHLRDAWTELTYQDEQPPQRTDPVAKATRSPAAHAKARTKRTPTGQPAHSFRSLLTELALQTRNTIRLPATDATYDKLTEPTDLQARALQLAGA
ncbi:MAG TPA: IS1634 family transposase [Thermoleophilaceae bacterium]|nr:IS1634 family transposase [Thermoleophilaceae bacterium]